MEADKFINQFMAEILSHAAAVLQDSERSKALWRNWSAQLDLLNAARSDLQALEGFHNAFPELSATIIRIDKEINGE